MRQLHMQAAVTYLRPWKLTCLQVCFLTFISHQALLPGSLLRIVNVFSFEPGFWKADRYAPVRKRLLQSEWNGLAAIKEKSLATLSSQRQPARKLESRGA